MSTTVICCRADRVSAQADPTVRGALARCESLEVTFVGQRPGKSIDDLLLGRILVIGDDSDLSAVVLRMLRTEQLTKVVVGYATDVATAVTDLWSLPLGNQAVDLAVGGEPDVVPIVRDDVGGVLVGIASLSDVRGTVYVDDRRVLSGSAAHVLVEPNSHKGLAVTIIPRRLAGFGRRSRTFEGRAVSIGTTPATVITDGTPHDRAMERWTFYKHTEPLRLVRGLL